MRESTKFPPLIPVSILFFLFTANLSTDHKERHSMPLLAPEPRAKRPLRLTSALY